MSGPWGMLPPLALRRPEKRMRWMTVLRARAAALLEAHLLALHAGAQALRLEPHARSS